MDFLDLAACSQASGTGDCRAPKAFPIACFAKDTTLVRALLDPDDTRAMLDPLRALGVGVAPVSDSDDL